MKYNILDFNQEKVLSLRKEIKSEGNKVKTIKLDIIDLHILQVLSDFMNRAKIIKYTIDDKTFFSVQYKVILDDLPILDIKQQALSDRLKKMAELEVIENRVVRNQSGSYSVFRMGKNYESLKYDCRSSRLQLQEYQTTSAEVVDYTSKDYSTNNYSTNNNKEDKDKSLYKKKSFNFKQSLIDIGVSNEVADDWIKVRKLKRAANTKTAFNSIKKQIEKSGISANECITIAVERSWQGFKAEWVDNISTSLFDKDKYVKDKIAELDGKINSSKVIVNGVEYK